MKTDKNFVAPLLALVASSMLALHPAQPLGAQQAGSPARGTVAKLKRPSGTVLVSQGDALVAGTNDQRLAVGTRVITTGTAEVTIEYDVGCDVHLKQNQRFTVTTGPCALLLAEAESVGPAAGAIGGGPGGTVAGAGVAGAPVGASATLGAVATAAAIAGLGIGAYETFRTDRVSPN